MWNEPSCIVVWTFFGIAFLWDWNENWRFPVLWPLLSFPIIVLKLCLTPCTRSTYTQQAPLPPRNNGCFFPFFVLAASAALVTRLLLVHLHASVWHLTFHYSYILDSPGGSDSKESTCNEGDLGSIPRLGGSPGKGNGYPLQYSGLEDSVDRGAWQATVHGVVKSQTQLSDFYFTSFLYFISKTQTIAGPGFRGSLGPLQSIVIATENGAKDIQTQISAGRPEWGRWLKVYILQ